MAISVTITDCIKQANGKILVKFSNNVGMEWPSMEELKASLANMETFDMAASFALARALSVGNDLTNKATFVGKTITIDTSAQNPITVK